MSTTPTTGVRCNRCERDVALVDEHGRCERCVLDAHGHGIALWDVKEYLEGARELGLTDAQIREAVDMHLTNRVGALAGAGVKRIEEDGDWQVDPPSMFLEDHDGAAGDPSNVLHKARRRRGVTREEVAEKVGEDVTTVALWEQGAPIPPDAAERLGELFDFKPHVFTDGMRLPSKED